MLVTGSSPSVIVGDLDIIRPILGPDEADGKLVVDADGMLALTVARQGFEAVAGRRAQIHYSCVANSIIVNLRIAPRTKSAGKPFRTLPRATASVCLFL